jgi:hypothetical protein
VADGVQRNGMHNLIPFQQDFHKQGLHVCLFRFWRVLRLKFPRLLHIKRNPFVRTDMDFAVRTTIRAWG